MIKISKPIIEEAEDKVYLKAFIENEKEQVSKYLWNSDIKAQKNISDYHLFMRLSYPELG